jgi:hypothetical protein
LLTVLELNGLDDALWCLCAVDGYDKEIRLYAVWCARRVQHLIQDSWGVEAIDTSERYALGQATLDDVSIAAFNAWAVCKLDTRVAVLSATRCAALSAYTPGTKAPVSYVASSARDAYRRELNVSTNLREEQITNEQTVKFIDLCNSVN